MHTPERSDVFLNGAPNHEHNSHLTLAAHEMKKEGKKKIPQTKNASKLNLFLNEE